MYSLLVGLNHGEVRKERLFEYTSDDIVKDIQSGPLAGLERIPALSMPEIGDTDFDQLATIGSIANLQRTVSGFSFTFTPDPQLYPIPLAEIERLATHLGVDGRRIEFIRTHWAVKDVDLYGVLLRFLPEALSRNQVDPRRERAAIRIPKELPRDPALVAVMMPFAPEFDVVYEAIRAAVSTAGLQCIRVDSIWEEDHIMADVLSLLYRARVVIADLTGRNANVFYEVGIAHALPRDTILLTQNRTDVPFDLQGIRYLEYGVGSDDRARLQARIVSRLNTLLGVDGP